MIFKYISYGLYMIFFGLKQIKYFFIKKTKGEEAALQYVYKSVHLWAKFTIKTVGMDIEVVGKENIPKETCVFMGNHTSILDIPTLLETVDRDIAFVAKKEMKKVPIFSFWIEKTKSLFLDRENPREGIKVINKGVEQIKAGLSMVIFPEGTRGKGDEILEFKKGSMKLATKAKVPIVPVAIEGAYKAFEENGKFKPSKIKITFCKPVYTENLTKDEEKVLHEIVRDEIVKKIFI